jgi:hypothetical protein
MGPLLQSDWEPASAAASDAVPVQVCTNQCTYALLDECGVGTAHLAIGVDKALAYAAEANRLEVRDWRGARQKSAHQPAYPALSG